LSDNAFIRFWLFVLGLPVKLSTRFQWRDPCGFFAWGMPPTSMCRVLLFSIPSLFNQSFVSKNLLLPPKLPENSLTTVQFVPVFTCPSPGNDDRLFDDRCRTPQPAPPCSRPTSHATSYRGPCAVSGGTLVMFTIFFAFVIALAKRSIASTRYFSASGFVLLGTNPVSTYRAFTVFCFCHCSCTRFHCNCKIAPGVGYRAFGHGSRKLAPVVAVFFSGSTSAPWSGIRAFVRESREHVLYVQCRLLCWCCFVLWSGCLAFGPGRREHALDVPVFLLFCSSGHVNGYRACARFP